MNIVCSNIDDFRTMITTCTLNGLKDIRVFISEENSYPNIAFPGSNKNCIKFTYVLFTSLYTAIYSDNVLNTDYEKIYHSLEQCQEQCNHDFRIQIFDTLNIKNNDLCIGKELKVI